MRNSAIQGQPNRSLSKDLQPRLTPQSPRRHLGDLNNINRQVYGNPQAPQPQPPQPPQPAMFPRPTVWTSRIDEHYQPQNAFYQPQHGFEPSYSYGSLQNARQMTMGLNDVRKSQAVAPAPRQASMSRERLPSSTSHVVSSTKSGLWNQPPSSLTNTNPSTLNSSNNSVSAIVEKSDSRPTSSVRGSMIRSPAKPQQPSMPHPPEEIVAPFRFRYSFRSQKGFIPNVVKENQDICIVGANLNNRPWQHFFAVCDGHGPTGHHISSFIRNHFLAYFMKAQEFHKKPQENLYLAFKAAIEGLLKETFESSTSGSTIVSCYIYQQRLFCANVGDSRAVMGSKDPQTGKWSARQLSNDHKPCVPSEAQRIWRCNGRIEPLKDQRGYPIGPMRVWLQNSQLPGLAMTRSIGDLVASQIGVIWEPQITEHIITPNDKMLILASDGVWEFLSNEEVVSRMAPFYENNQLEEASKFLMDHSTAAWKNNMPMVDDISFVVLFFNHNE